MIRASILAIAASVAAGCISTRPAAVISQPVIPFPYPGIYSGAVANGTLTYKLAASGRGLGCFRNSLTGRLFLGDIAYDGKSLYTEDGTFNVVAVTNEQLKLSAYGLVNADLVKVDQPPTVCREFFSK